MTRCDNCEALRGRVESAERQASRIFDVLTTKEEILSMLERSGVFSAHYGNSGPDWDLVREAGRRLRALSSTSPTEAGPSTCDYPGCSIAGCHNAEDAPPATEEKDRWHLCRHDILKGDCPTCRATPAPKDGE